MKKTKNKKLIYIGFLYIVFLLFIKIINNPKPIYLLNKNMSGINIIPMKTVIEYVRWFNQYNTSILVKGFLSMFIFAPLAIYILLNRENFKKLEFKVIFFYFLGISFIYSLLSRILRIGYFDIDSIILRGIIASCIFLIIKKRGYYEKE